MHDIAVIGLGALGVHVVREAARRGLGVLGLEAGDGGHENTATGGRTRIFRLAYTFGSDYVPALQRSKEAWDALAAAHPEVRFDTGALMIGAPEDPEIAKAVSTAEEFSLPHELLDADALATRWPMHRLLPGDTALYDPAGALLIPPAITRLAAEEARRAGADLRYSSPVASLAEDGTGNTITLADGTELRARTVVVAAGAWSGTFVPEFGAAVELRRAVLHWFATPDAEAYGPARFPVGLRRSGAIRYSFFPQVDEAGVKVNLHAPKRVARAPEDNEVTLPAHMDTLIAGLHQTLSGLGERAASAAYVESYTPDYRVLLGPAEGTRSRWLLAGGSGQAFKFAPVLAEHLVERIVGDEPTLSLAGVVRTAAERPAEKVAGP